MAKGRWRRATKRNAPASCPLRPAGARSSNSRASCLTYRVSIRRTDKCVRQKHGAIAAWPCTLQPRRRPRANTRVTVDLAAGGAVWTPITSPTEPLFHACSQRPYPCASFLDDGGSGITRPSLAAGDCCCECRSRPNEVPAGPKPAGMADLYGGASSHRRPSHRTQQTPSSRIRCRELKT
jgi:hypothetical protein